MKIKTTMRNCEYVITSGVSDEEELETSYLDDRNVN
jgi:hypothetical protein